MDDHPPMPEPTSDLDRLNVYGAALRRMRAGQFDTPSDLGEGDGPIEALGHEMVELAIWLERRFTEFKMLQDLSEKVGTALFADDVLDRIFDTFHKLIPYDRIGCALLTEDGTKLKAYWARSQYTDVKVRKGYTEKLSGSSLMTILDTGMPRIINDLETYLAAHPESKSTRMIVAEGVRSSLTCPLIANGKPLGFLFFSSCQKDTYRDLHNAIFLKIAGQISVLMEKSLLYQDLFDLNAKLNDAHAALQRQARHDALTGVLNRGAIFAELDAALDPTQTSASSVAVIMADLDHFKAVNDTYGHQAGDAVLQATAQELQGIVAATQDEAARVGRYGGEEFLVVLPGVDAEAACTLAEALRQGVATLDVPHEDGMIRLTLSLGVAISHPREDAQPLIARADRALYSAKETGRNRAHVAEEPPQD